MPKDKPSQKDNDASGSSYIPIQQILTPKSNPNHIHSALKVTSNLYYMSQQLGSRFKILPLLFL